VLLKLYPNSRSLYSFDLGDDDLFFTSSGLNNYNQLFFFLNKKNCECEQVKNVLRRIACAFCLSGGCKLS
jgi:hypothetical protein